MRERDRAIGSRETAESWELWVVGWDGRNMAVTRIVETAGGMRRILCVQPAQCRCADRQGKQLGDWWVQARSHRACPLPAWPCRSRCAVVVGSHRGLRFSKCPDNLLPSADVMLPSLVGRLLAPRRADGCRHRVCVLDLLMMLARRGGFGVEWPRRRRGWRKMKVEAGSVLCM